MRGKIVWNWYNQYANCDSKVALTISQGLVSSWIIIDASLEFLGKDYKHLGCYKEDYFNQALPKFLDFVKTVEECAVLAENSGFTTFGVQLYPMYGTECYSGSKADKTYDKHGTSKACSGGLGGDDANDVYQFTGTTVFLRLHQDRPRILLQWNKNF